MADPQDNAADAQVNPPQQQISTPSQATTGGTSVTGTDPTQQPQQPQQAPQGPQAQQPQGQQGQQPAPQQPAPKPPVPFHQKLLNDARAITDAMAGPRAYTTKIDPTTGETTRTPVPVSRTSIGLSIAIAALGGLGAGSSVHSNNPGESLQAGFKAGQEQADKVNASNAQQDQQAQTDLRNRQQVISNLLQTRQLAMSLGRQSLDDAQENVKAFAPQWEAAQQDPASIYGQDMSHDAAYAMVNKLPMGTAQVIITGAHPRLDPNTNTPVYTLNGVPVPENTPGAYVAPDFTYAVIKPDTKTTITDADGKLSADSQQAAKQGFMGVAGSPEGKLPPNYQISAKAYQAGITGTHIAKTIQDDVNRARVLQNLDPLNIDSDLATSSNIRNGMLFYNGQIAGGASHEAAAKALLASPFKDAAGTIQGWYGGPDGASLLDAQRNQTLFESGVQHGVVPLDNPTDIGRARASSNPAVKAAGDAAQTRVDKTAANAEFLKSRAEEQGKLPGELKLAQVRANAANNPTNVPGDPQYVNEVADPNTGLREKYISSLGADGPLVRQIVSGRTNPTSQMTRTDKNGNPSKLMQEVAIASPDYSLTKGSAFKDVLTSYEKGPVSAQVNALRTAYAHMNQAYNSISTVSTVPGVRNVAALFNHDANKLANAKGVLVEEINKAWSSKALTDPEREAQLAQVNAASPWQMKDTLQNFAEFLHDKMEATQRQYNDAKPSAAAPDFRVMSPEAAEHYTNITGKQPSGLLAGHGNQQAPATPQGTGAPLPGLVGDGKGNYMAKGPQGYVATDASGRVLQQ